MGDLPGNFTSLLVASYSGLSEVVERLPKEAFIVNIRDREHRRSDVSFMESDSAENTSTSPIMNTSPSDLTPSNGGKEE